MPSKVPVAFSAASVVALGKFIPDIFQVEALVKSEVLSQAEADRSQIKAFLPNQVVHFALPWGEVLVLPDRLQATASEAPFIRVTDLIGQIMDMAEDRCQIRAFGINFEAHYDLGSITARDEFAMKFAPPAAWGAWGSSVRESMNSTDPEVHGGLALISMRERFREGDITGWYDVVLTSSEKVSQSTGIVFRTNHHHDFRPLATTAEDAVPSAEYDKKRTTTLLAALEGGFDNSIGKAESIFAEVLS